MSVAMPEHTEPKIVNKPAQLFFDSAIQRCTPSKLIFQTKSDPNILKKSRLCKLDLFVESMAAILRQNRLFQHTSRNKANLHIHDLRRKCANSIGKRFDGLNNPFSQILATTGLNRMRVIYEQLREFSHFLIQHIFDLVIHVELLNGPPFCLFHF